MLKDSRQVYRVPGWQQYDWLEHGFGTRYSNDWPDAARVAMVKQVHSSRVLQADGRAGYIGEGDALISNCPGLLIGVRTADCVPILLVDATRRVVAAIHAGWRGTADEIARKTVERLEEALGARPADIHAAIGPAIGPCCYEVGPEVAARFVRWLPELDCANGRVNLDLTAVNRKQLEGAGLPADHIVSASPCTFCSEDLHSYRRDGARAGRLVSAIGISATRR